MEEKKENCSNEENINTKLDDLPEPEISENEMKEIIDIYIYNIYIKKFINKVIFIIIIIKKKNKRK